VLELVITGRGGQGSQLAGKILAEVFFREGRHVLSFATYGGARRGTPVTSSLRVADRPIRLRCDIERPDVIVCFDPSLLSEGKLLTGATADTRVLINSARPAGEFGSLGPFEAATIDASAIAGRHRLGRIVNTALVGAVLGLLAFKSVGLLENVIAESSPDRAAENVAACLEGYSTVAERAG
jgi:pyruvate ferredoxin oxidoreductase gamma subunit